MRTVQIVFEKIEGTPDLKFVEVESLQPGCIPSRPMSVRLGTWAQDERGLQVLTFKVPDDQIQNPNPVELLKSEIEKATNVDGVLRAYYTVLNFLDIGAISRGLASDLVFECMEKMSRYTARTSVASGSVGSAEGAD